MAITPRQRFLDYVRGQPGARPVVSPFLPHAPLVAACLRRLGLRVTADPVADEIALAHALDYEPMFMTACAELIFPWRDDPARSDATWRVATLETPAGTWERRVSRRAGLYGEDGAFPLRGPADHELLVAACAAVPTREAEIRRYFAAFRRRVGESGVIVIGHPHITWLGGQISPAQMVYQAADHPELFGRSMEAVFTAALFVFAIALEEGVDFMSESGYGLEMISPRQFAAQDLPYTRRLAEWTHARGGLFWYHNCGHTRRLIEAGLFDALGADVVETLAPPPEGDNELAAARARLSPRICSKGNLSLILLRDGTPAEVAAGTRAMVRAAAGFRHIHSTADAVFAETPPENFLAFVRAARAAAAAG